MAERFGCCHNYLRCSNEMRCTYEDDPEYSGCSYRKHLESGNIFYGKNARKNILERHWDFPLYIECFEFNLKVTKNIRGYSYSLKEKEREDLKKIFDTLGIPCTTQLKESSEERGGSRVIIKMPDLDYTVMNNDGRLIPCEVSQKLARAIENKGIECFVETFRTGTRFDKKQVKKTTKRVEKEITKELKVPTGTQISIFDLGA